MNIESFKHQMGGHCESGVTNTLLNNEGIKISEPLAFGIGSGLFFVHIPFLKVMGFPMTSYRSFPGSIFKKACKRLDLTPRFEKFRNIEKGEKRLDQLLDQGKLVGMQTNIYWLNYIPERFRFHFNAHNLIAVKADEQNYFVSDPIVDEVVSCTRESLNKARFSKGPLSPRGLLYYLDQKHENKINFNRAIYKGIEETTKRMLFVPVPLFGLKGIRLLGNQIKKWPNKLTERKCKLYLSSVVRMQEEIGTGGAGFRALYASFLNEAGELLDDKRLVDYSYMMEEISDMWKNFAVVSVSICRNRGNKTYDEAGSLMLDIYRKEKEFFSTVFKGYVKCQ